MIFKSHMISMIIYALIVSVVISFIRFDEKRDILKEGLKLFATMTGGVIAASWFMNIF